MNKTKTLIIVFILIIYMAFSNVYATESIIENETPFLPFFEEKNDESTDDTENSDNIGDSDDNLTDDPEDSSNTGNGSGSSTGNSTGSGGGSTGSGGGGSSYKPSNKPIDKPETTDKTESVDKNEVADETKPQQEQIQTENNIKTFSDVEKGDWFYDDVMFAFNNNIMKGTGENEFSPNTTLNRAMMITILHRIDGDTSVYKENVFNDVEKNSWYENAVNWGFENKIISGVSESSFAPFNNLTREQLCVMLYNYTIHIGFKTEYADISLYSDNKTVSEWAKDAVSWAVQEKIVTGKGNNVLAPKDSATRAETAAVIRRYTKKFARTEEK